MAEASVFGRNVTIQNVAFLVSGAPNDGSPDATGTLPLFGVVPADGAELISAKFTCTSVGSVGTSGTQQWSISDGTNALATMAAASAVNTVGNIITLTTTTATNGKAIATTAGAALVLTNTEVGTVIDGMHGIFTFAWGL